MIDATPHAHRIAFTPLLSPRVFHLTRWLGVNQQRGAVENRLSFPRHVWPCRNIPGAQPWSGADNGELPAGGRSTTEREYSASKVTSFSSRRSQHPRSIIRRWVWRAASWNGSAPS